MVDRLPSILTLLTLSDEVNLSVTEATVVCVVDMLDRVLKEVTIGKVQNALNLAENSFGNS